MLGFFGSPKVSADVALDAVAEYARSSFERLSSPIVKKCSGKLAELAYAIDGFSNALERFSSINDEPDEEQLVGAGGASFVKAQKASYQKAIYNAVAALKRSLDEVKAPTGYERMQDSLSAYASFVSKVLSINSTFKAVMFGYPSGISLFKKPFSNVEKRIKELEYEISLGAQYFSEYKRIVNAAALISAHVDGLAALKSAESDAASSHGAERDSMLKEMELQEQAVASLEAELNGLEANLHSKRAAVETLLKPLERLARKADHASKGKSRISAYIEMPFDAQFSGSPYSGFSELLAHLREAVEKGAVENENLKLAQRHLDRAESEGIDQKISEIKALGAKAEALRSKISEQKMLAVKYRGEVEKIEHAAMRRADISEREVKLAAEIDKEKTELSRMLSEAYGKPVRIL
ncbi:MAG: hypothetical protein QXR58_01740 [Candidatus Micrarchaeaceae archaeon]